MGKIFTEDGYINEETGIEYVREGDYYVPKLKAPEPDDRPVGKYGEMHKDYLKSNNYAEYARLLMSGTLKDYLIEIHERTLARIDDVTSKMLEQSEMPDKEKNPTEYNAELNGIRLQAEELALDDIVYNI